MQLRVIFFPLLFLLFYCMIYFTTFYNEDVSVCVFVCIIFLILKPEDCFPARNNTLCSFNYWILIVQAN